MTEREQNHIYKKTGSTVSYEARKQVEEDLKNIELKVKKELDIYLPNLNIAIEYNGLYWHGEKNKDKNYHLEKYNLCQEKRTLRFLFSILYTSSFDTFNFR